MKDDKLTTFKRQEPPEFCVFVTPVFLRRLADTLEAQGQGTRWGDFLPKHSFYGDGYSVSLILDPAACASLKEGPVNKDEAREKS